MITNSKIPPAILLIAATLLAGCGLKGDLYLDEPPPAESGLAESAPAESAPAENPAEGTNNSTSADEISPD